VLSTNIQDKKASIQVIVDEIWNQYDIDGNGSLDKNEIRQFVNEYLPEFNPEFEFSEPKFEQIFEEFDIDGDGTVDKYEMTEFITNLLSKHDDKN